MAKLFEDSDQEATAERIQALFTKLGGNITAHDLALAALKHKIFTRDELKRIRLRGVVEACYVGTR